MNATDQEGRVFAALQHIRDAPGTVYSRELYGLLGLSSTEERPSTEDDGSVIDMLNGWYEHPLVAIDGASTRALPGMVEMATNTRYRIFLDLLLSMHDGYEPRLHPHSVTLSERREKTVVVEHVYRTLSEPGRGTDVRRETWRRAVADKYAVMTEERSREMPRMTVDELAQRAIGSGDDLFLDVSGFYLEDFDISRAGKGKAPHDSTVRLKANGAVFAGAHAHFGNAVYRGFDVGRAVFTAEKIDFSHAVFAISPAEYDTEITGSASFRDATFCRTVDHLSLDDAEVIGDTYGVTFEDAVFDAVRVTFARFQAGSGVLDFYQTRFLGSSVVEFVEASLEESRLTFDDATLGEIVGQEALDPEAAVVFYRCGTLPPAEFRFRAAREVRLENSAVDAPVRFANIERISLWSTSFSGGPIIVDATPGTPVFEAKTWFLDALEAGRGAHRAALASEFAIVKEVFNGMGEYDLEDQAFVRHMRYKGISPVSRASYRVLDVVGRFGTAPLRTMLWFLGAFLVLAACDALLIAAAPGWIAGSLGNPIVDGIVFAATSLVQAQGSVQPAVLTMNIISVVQALIGWFFLGYLFSAFVRRTMR